MNTGEEGKETLFWLGTIFTVIYFLIVALKCLKIVSAPIPQELATVYVVLIAAYAGVKEANHYKKVKIGQAATIKKRPGEGFFVAWVLLFLVIVVLTIFNFGNASVLLSEIYQTVIGVIIIFCGASGFKIIKRS